MYTRGGVKFGPRSCKFVMQIFNEVNFSDLIMPLYVAKSHSDSLLETFYPEMHSYKSMIIALGEKSSSSYQLTLSTQTLKKRYIKNKVS